MKFRHFEFRFFPRIRTKKKKKSKYSETSLDKNFPLDKNFNYSKISYENVALDRTVDATYDTGSDVYENGLSYMRSNSDYAAYQEHCCYYSQTYPLPNLTIDVENICNCEACAHSVVSSAGATLFCANPAQTPFGTPLCTPNTIPRTRTRIKTNPWLPSPRTTPSLSPTGTVESVLYSSTEFPFRNISDYRLAESKESTSIHSLIQFSNLQDNETNLSKVTEENIDSVLDDTNETIDETSKEARKRFSFTEFLRYDTEGSKCASPVVEQIEIVGNISCKISFKYEETVDDLLEHQDVIPRDATFLSIKDLLEDDYRVDEKCQSVLSEDIDCSNETNNVETESSAISSYNKMDISASSESEISDVISNMDLTSYDEGYMLESIDTGYGSAGARDSDDNSEGEFEPPQTTEEPSFDEAELEWDNDPSAEALQGIDNNQYHSCGTDDISDRIENNENCTRPRSRSLADIEASLDEKVTLLREEKYFVQRKIREAKEEEEVRRKQVQLFRAYSVDDRKAVLLKTLNDLKARLENQSARLQTSYNTVLSIQRTFSKRRRPVLETMI